MKQHWGPRLWAILALLLLAGAGRSAAATRLDDAAAWSRLGEMERTGVLSDPFWAQAFWLQSRAAPDPDTRIADLRWALRFDEDFNAARWALALELLEQRNGEFANQIVLVGQHAASSFLTQEHAALWVLTVGLGALFAAFVVVALAAVARTAPLVHHGVWERLLFLPGELRWGAALLTVAAPIALAFTLPPTATLLWLLAIGTAGAWTFLDRMERRTCVTAGLLVLLAPVAFGIWTRFTEISHPSSYLRSLWTAQAAPEGFEVLQERTGPGKDSEDAGYLASLALLERRAGRYEDAIAHLETAVRLEPNSWAFLNNLGNARLLAGDPDGALVEYEHALRLSPNEALVMVNQAQAWMRQLRFTRAELALQQAAKLGYRLPRVLNNGPQDIVVRDRVLDAGEFWLRFARGIPHSETLSWRSALAMTLAPVFPLRPLWMCLVPFVALYFATRARSIPKGHRCAGCGRVICRKCHYRVLRRSLCATCNAIRVDVRAPLKREALLRDRRVRTLRWPRLAGLLASALLPGTGHFLSGAPRRAWISAATAAALLLVAGAGALWPAPGADAFRGASRWTTGVPIALYVLVALGSVRAYWRFTSRNLNVGMAKPRSA